MDHLDVARSRHWYRLLWLPTLATFIHPRKFRSQIMDTNIIPLIDTYELHSFLLHPSLIQAIHYTNHNREYLSVIRGLWKLYVNRHLPRDTFIDRALYQLLLVLPGLEMTRAHITLIFPRPSPRTGSESDHYPVRLFIPIATPRYLPLARHRRPTLVRSFNRNSC
jgi:hypothetical protein